MLHRRVAPTLAQALCGASLPHPAVLHLVVGAEVVVEVEVL
jgi:hypothetical protein